MFWSKVKSIFKRDELEKKETIEIKFDYENHELDYDEDFYLEFIEEKTDLQLKKEAVIELIKTKAEEKKELGIISYVHSYIERVRESDNEKYVERKYTDFLNLINSIEKKREIEKNIETIKQKPEPILKNANSHYGRKEKEKVSVELIYIKDLKEEWGEDGNGNPHFKTFHSKGEKFVGIGKKNFENEIFSILIDTKDEGLRVIENYELNFIHITEVKPFVNTIGINDEKEIEQFEIEEMEL